MSSNQSVVVDRTAGKLAQNADGFFDGSASLHQFFVVGRSLDLAVSDSFAELVERDLVDVSSNRFQAAGKSVVVIHQLSPINSHPSKTERCCHDVGGMHHREARAAEDAGEMHRTARVGARDQPRVGSLRRPIDRGDLPLADLASQFRLQGRVRTAGAAAESIVVEFDDISDVTQQRSYRIDHSLHMAKVARILDDHLLPLACCNRKSVDTLGQILVQVEDPGAERLGVWCAK